MKLGHKKITLRGADGAVEIIRGVGGVPVLEAASTRDMQFGLGWTHAADRQLEALLMRVLLRGRAAECLQGDPALIEIDKFMRLMDFLPQADLEGEMAKLQPQVRAELDSYCAGFNQGLADCGLIWEMRLMGYKPDPWSVADCLLLGKAFGFVGLVDAQMGAQRLLIQMIQNDLPEAKIRELFPYLSEPIDYDLIKKIELSPPLVPEAVKWLAKLPKFQASNNWAVSGRHTASGAAFLCGDPHLEVNRLPAIWQEIVAHLPDDTIIGACIPGAPGPIVGRTSRIAWSATYSFMDMLDFRIEQCQGGKYRRGEQWREFRARQEIIKVKKGQPISFTVYENEHGVLEGDPFAEGHKLVLGWSARHGCGAGEFNGLLNLLRCQDVAQAMACFRELDAATFNFVIADDSGNIGYQMSGRMFQRAPGLSGLLPMPGWEAKHNHQGYVDKHKLPSQYNPAEGFIVTANQDLNHLGTAKPINLPMAPYRANRISQLLRQGRQMGVDYFKAMHFDLHSLQAERFMALLRPLLPDSQQGRLLADWDLSYQADSLGATAFESVYLAMIRVVFGDGGMGRPVIDYVLTETGAFNDYYGNFDEVIMKADSAWFDGRPREELLRRALEEGLAQPVKPYGQTRQIMLSHLLFGGKLPAWLGFDHGPIALPGGRATIPQGQIFKSAGRLTTFSPSLRFICDMATRQLHSTLAGGPSDRRFGPWYVNGVQDWLAGNYKLLE